MADSPPATAARAPRRGGPAVPPPRPSPRPRFETVARGYEPAAVDAHVDSRTAEVAALRRDLDISERRRRQAEHHAGAADAELRSLRDGGQADHGFGQRIERVLRLAEQEASDLRDSAAPEASSLIEGARARAEQHRHEVEQDLIARSAVLDGKAAQRSAELLEREQQIGEQLAAARAEAGAVREAADREAQRGVEQADADARQVRDRAAQEARELVAQAGKEADRLGAVQVEARTDITRLVELLTVQLALGAPPTVATGRTSTRRPPRLVADGRYRGSDSRRCMMCSPT